MTGTFRLMFRAATAALLVVLVLAGCGGGGSHTATSGSSITVSSAGAATPSTSSTSATGAATHTAKSSSTPSVPNATTYGHPASAADKAAVAQVVKAYYASLSSGHEAAACSMLSNRIEGLLERSVKRSPLLHGKGCIGAYKLLFGRRPGRPNVVASTVSVTGVRVSGDRGYALVATRSIPSGQIRIEREHGSWKIGSLIAEPVAAG